MKIAFSKSRNDPAKRPAASDAAGISLNTPAASPDPGLAPAKMRDLVRHWYEDLLSGTVANPTRPSTWDQSDLDLSHFFTPDYENHVVPAPPGGWRRGPAAARQMIQAYRLSYPDLTMHIVEQMVSGDRVVTRYTVEGTHTARPFLHAPPTARHYEITGIAIDRISGGKIAESWGLWDMCSLMIQMGLLPQDLQTLD